MATHEELFQNLVKDLEEKYDCHGIILYGSMAKSEYTPKSDIDIICFVDSDIELTDNRIIEGRYLDCWIRSTPTLEGPQNMAHQFLHLLDGKILLDKNGFCQSLIHKAKEAFENGPKAISENKRQHIKAWSYKTLDRVSRGDLEGSYRRMLLINDLLRFYFELRSLWFLGPKQAFNYLKEFDPDTYKKFKKVLKDPTNNILLRSLTYKVVD